MMELLDRDKEYFNEVTKPKLFHWDLWADELMEVGFRTFADNNDFLNGYGIELTNE